MNPTREEALFQLALGKPATKRAAWLDAICEDDAALRQRLEALLAAHDGTGGILAGDSVPEDLTPTLELPEPVADEAVGQTLGRYKLLERVGEGGCGVVYVAEQTEPVRRRVALKVIKLGMDTKQVVARFEAERQALALMDHPNIAKVLDAGTTEPRGGGTRDEGRETESQRLASNPSPLSPPSGRPYFVMELVRGIKITDYCDQANLTTKDRLNLFIKVCQAIQHAHQKGIIHRDIKPSNILVTLHDGVPVPKVIDFGIAKATEGRLTDATVYTQLHQFIGTPAYMSPEQAEMSGLDIDTRSDIYSLGVLLYELLTGSTPFDGKELMSAGIDAMRRTIREKEPQRPSTRLATLGADKLTTTAKRRSADTSKLLHQLKGDLDWIAMKCLEKDRQRRYETANGVAADITRHLNNEPVTARPPSTAYRFQKAFRRNKLVFTAATAVVAALLVGISISVWQAARATKARIQSDASRQAAQVSEQKAVEAQAKEAQLRKQAEAARMISRRQAYAADMNLARQALAQDNLARTRQLLNRQVPGAGETDLRGWEWRYLWGQSQPDPHDSIYTNRDGRLNSLDISADGNHIGLEIGFVHLMDLATKASTPVEEGPQGARVFHSGLALAHRAPWVAYSRLNGTNFTLHIQDWLAKKDVMPPQDIADFFPRQSAFTPDDRVLMTLGVPTPWSQVSHSDPNRVRLSARLVATGEELWTKEIHQFGGGGWMRRLDVSSDGTAVAVTAMDGRVQVLRLRDGSERLNLKVTDEIAMVVRFSPDGRMLATAAGYGDPLIRLWDLTNGRELGRLEGHQAYVSGLTFTPDGRQLVSSSADYTIRVWDLASRRTISTLRGHQDEVDGVVLSPDGRTIISRCKDGMVFRWSMPGPDDRRGFRTAQVDVTDRSITSLRFQSDGQTLLAERSTLPPLRLDLVGLQVTSNRFAADRPVLAWTLDGERFVATLEEDRDHLGVFEANSRKLVATIPCRTKDERGKPVSPGFLEFVDGGKWLVRGVAPLGIQPSLRFFATVEWYSTANWRKEGQMTVGGEGILVRVLSCERGWLPVLRKTEFEVFNLALTNSAGIRFARPGGDISAKGFVAAPDLNYAASADEGGLVWVWDWNSRELKHRFKAFRLGAHSIERSPDGRRLAVGSGRDEAVKLWDTESWEEVLTLQGEGSLFLCPTFSPDGRHLVAVNYNGLVHLWSAPSMEEITALQDKAPKEAAKP